MSNKLYVIGNGFDLHHNLKTSYLSYADYIEENYTDLFKKLVKYVECPCAEDSLWWQFEDNLANLNTDRILQDNESLLPDCCSDDFRSRDAYTFSDEMRDTCEFLTSTLINSFTEFIQKVSYPNSSREKLVDLDNNALFLTFNYTKTLELLYNVDKRRIKYIHNSAFYGRRDIILGHGLSPDKCRREYEGPEPPDDLPIEKYEEWYLKNYYIEDPFYDDGKDNLLQYFSQTYKPTVNIIKENKSFFENLKNVEEIIVLGHSISGIDLPYFKELVSSTNSSVKWQVSYYNVPEKEKHLKTLMSLGVEKRNISQITLNDIQKFNKQLKLDI